MAALGLALVWAGYTTGLYGYCLLRGYNVSPKQLFSPFWPPVSPDKSPVAFTVGQATKNATAPIATAAGNALKNLKISKKK
jgi:hypothetical protein